MKLTMFWVDLAEPSTPWKSNRLGIGLTARDERDARSILLAAFGLEISDAVVHIRPIRFADIEPNHVRPNMGLHMARGVWFPDVGTAR